MREKKNFRKARTLLSELMNTSTERHPETGIEMQTAGHTMNAPLKRPKTTTRKKAVRPNAGRAKGHAFGR